VPDTFETPVVGDWTTPVTLDVQVILVGVAPEGAAAIMRHVVDTYAALNIQVKWQAESVDLKIDPAPDTSATGAILSTSDSEAFIQASKDYYGGQRPWWADVVYTMIGGELASSVAGQADCVGGIAFPDAAFAVGEAETDNPGRIHVSARIAAHEIAHLLAAHHHFANCVEGNKDDLVEYFTPCTLMINDVGLVSLGFSTLEGAVVRRYALDYAVDTPTSPPQPDTEPEPDPEAVVVERDVTLGVNKNNVAKGRVTSDADDSDFCTNGTPIMLERRNRAGRWVEIDETTTNTYAAFAFRLTKPGRYRATAPEDHPTIDVTCAPAVSPSIRRA
jgi:hypothetical protein